MDHPTAVAILDATGTLLMEHSLEQLSVARILEQANVSRATFYFYFENKDDVFIALFEQIAHEITGRFSTLLTADRSDRATVESVVAQCSI
ncbi:TetR/AcrR family transcriptional regulator [Nocardia sp. NPDC059246]|uniref:TetR/AcrR family transcriptional regulator n=1 Tax=unclassified Nocardia TaxID=2637762 RepID=UPI00367DC22F